MATAVELPTLRLRPQLRLRRRLSHPRGPLGHHRHFLQSHLRTGNTNVDTVNTPQSPILEAIKPNNSMLEPSTF